MQAIRNIDRKQGQQDIKNKKDNKADNRYCPEILRPQFFFHIRQPCPDGARRQRSAQLNDGQVRQNVS